MICHFNGAQDDSVQFFLSWSVLGGETWCNQVTSLHEGNQPTVKFYTDLFLLSSTDLIAAQKILTCGVVTMENKSLSGHCVM